MTSALATYRGARIPMNQTERVVVMYQLVRQLGAAAVMAIAASSIAIAADDDSRGERDAYVVTPLVSNISGQAAKTDSILQNAWGIAFSPAGSPFWVNDN